jgi:NAD(P)-dependent dehydrogenase (short-subunit alcohol dehydrogenase family)
MADPNVYREKVAIVTGAASGIGAAIAKQIAAAGAQVVLADRQVELAESVASTIRASGGTAVAVELDVRELASMTRVVEETVTRWGGVHYFFNNAGIGVGGETEQYEPRDWDDTFDVNLRGVAYGIQAVYPVMIRQKSGHIINTASVAGLLPVPGQTAYGASKHAVVGLSKSLRIEAKRHGIQVSVLCPGLIRTPILTGGKYGRVHMPGSLTEQKLLKMWERLRPMNVDVFARKVTAAVARNQAIIVVPAWWKMLWYLERLSPTLSSKLSEAFFARMRAETESPDARPIPPPQPGVSTGSNGASSASKTA